MARRRTRRSTSDPTSSSGEGSDDDDQRPAKRARVGPAGPSMSANSNKKRLPRDHYTLAWICALYHELFAARRMLDEEHEEHSSNDDNHYIFGRVAKHNVIIACLPEGHYGTVRATRVLTELRNSYPSVTRCLLVGIGGGFPNLPSNDIRLGDVLVGRQVVSYDEGKQHSDGRFQITGDTMRPSKSMLTALSMLRAKLEDSATATVLVDTVQARLPGETQYHRPNADDVLFSSNHDEFEIVNRIARPSIAPHVHYGTIASGNTLIKDSKLRDRLALQLSVIGTEMEAGGLMGILPLLVIRGVSDYSDAHKNDVWQKYAAANAAAFAREYLEILAAPTIAIDTESAPDERPTIHEGRLH
ncbi:phosphorylase superfamily protein [Sarocladium implicatum]|nr:phosphorylase superfamily protein [Sarocladium implicatum]